MINRDFTNAFQLKFAGKLLLDYFLTTFRVPLINQKHFDKILLVVLKKDM